MDFFRQGFTDILLAHFFAPLQNNFLINDVMIVKRLENRRSLKHNDQCEMLVPKYLAIAMISI